VGCIWVGSIVAIAGPRAARGEANPKPASGLALHLRGFGWCTSDKWSKDSLLHSQLVLYVLCTCHVCVGEFGLGAGHLLYEGCEASPVSLRLDLGPPAAGCCASGQPVGVRTRCHHQNKCICISKAAALAALTALKVCRQLVLGGPC
jgi:hypothetical protein